MSKPRGLYHYEFIKQRGRGHQWRVGDQDDDMVCDFGTEREARKFVQKHNATLEDDLNWNYGMTTPSPLAALVELAGKESNAQFIAGKPKVAQLLLDLSTALLASEALIRQAGEVNSECIEAIQWALDIKIMTDEFLLDNVPKAKTLDWLADADAMGRAQKTLSAARSIAAEIAERQKT